MKVGDIMKSPAITIGEHATLREAVALLSKAGVSALPIVDDEERLVGIVSEHDVIRAVLPTYEDLLSADAALLNPEAVGSRVMEVRDNPVSSIMVRKVATAAESDSVLKTASTMILKRVKRLPVVKDGRIVGIIGRVEILQAIMRGGM